MNAQQIIDGLEDLYAQREYLTAQKTALIDSVVPAEVKAKIAEIEAEFECKASAVGTQIAELETMIKSEVIQAGKSIKGTYLQAVYNKGKPSWNTKEVDEIISGMDVVIRNVRFFLNEELQPETKLKLIESIIKPYFDNVAGKLPTIKTIGEPYVSFRKYEKRG